MIEFRGTPSVGGVYAIYQGKKLLYIGSSDCVCYRLTSYRNSPVFKEAHVRTFACLDYTAVENWLIATFKPPLNKTSPRGLKKASISCLKNLGLFEEYQRLKKLTTTVADNRIKSVK